MERQIVASRMVQSKEKKENSINKEEYFQTKQVSDESEELEKSCLTEEEEEACLSDASQGSKKRTRELATTCESNKRKRQNPSKETWCNDTFFDDWLFGNNQQKNAEAAIKNDIHEDMIMKLQQRSSGDSCFTRAQFLSQVGIFALPYTVMF